jgi:EAL domain-containing protein (putative c-di-GMP-specific phosphodiesterase class I)
LGCDIGQGYFIAHPMPAAAVLDWLSAWGKKTGSVHLLTA